ncbi:MAG: hypothetical protein NT148_02175 [Candidatus Nealsonbacteria bacterium]|nr:hypothetical protein [Candidatus Nealsonbacteria bacterium]
MVTLYQADLKEHPKKIAEIGPGDSLGIGLATLLTGASQYYAFDIIEHSNVDKNLKILEELVELFLQKASIPDHAEFPELKPDIDNYSFPDFLSTDDIHLDKKRIDSIRKALVKGISDDGLIEIRYIVPWMDNVATASLGHFDLIFSQAVMEHVMDLQPVYEKMYFLLRNGGYMSHQIDYKAHETHSVWNGHCLYSDIMWKIIMKGRNYPINRMVHSTHRDMIKKVGFIIINEKRVENNSGYVRSKLPMGYKNLSQKDLTTSSAHILAVKYPS